MHGLDARDEAARVIYGVDPLQAVQLALEVARAVLEGSAEWKEGRLTFMGDSRLRLPLATG